MGLRAVLIHRGLKLIFPVFWRKCRLRAVLIHRGLKQEKDKNKVKDSLRAVLIHRGLKPIESGADIGVV